MANCTFCGKSMKHTGKMYVQKSGKIMYFCTMKCEKNMLKLKRKPLETKWVTKKKKEKKK
ncbi:50S ribosomal protein L24e [Candidatus Woesearchaeota archaeon]|jgi:large subunit ribosomal protein L24e|nr:50S ribosomal protein L24e [Candidatus Woesearchaeota archaeon]MBW3014621.1 50S ribosomal protein L24e [Candidatus Woesearchaeota archaeon]